MQGHQKIALFLAVALVAGCRTERPQTEPVPVTNNEPAIEGVPIGDDRTAMEAAIDAGPSGAAHSVASMDNAAPREGMALAPGAPDNYVVKRGDTLWGIAKVFFT